MNRKLNQIRIIAGKWRGRKISFSSVAGLRPTGNKIRETVFNWLQMSITSSKCLDLFSGAGVFGFEALSRDAGLVVMVDQNRKVIESIKKNTEILGVDNDELVILHAAIPSDALKATLSKHQFDIVFIDPPFYSGLVRVACQFLQDANCLAEDALVYIETEAELELVLPDGWEIFREKKAGKVRYYLVKSIKRCSSPSK